MHRRRADRILVVEDDQDIRELLGMTLAEQLGPVELAVDGVDALERIVRGGVPAALLLDLNLPRLSGQGLVERLAALGLGGIPVVTMSASWAEPPPGVRIHLRKPFLIERAVEALREVIGACQPPAAAAAG
jgi:CheY-like chemotaxis protein